MSHLTKFNTQVDHLIKKLLDIVVDKDLSRDLKIFNEKYKIVRSTNPKIILQAFLKYIYPYKDQIMNKEEKFFLGDEIDDDLNKKKNEIIQDSGQSQEFILTKALHLKELWKNHLSPTNKEVIWKYFQVLIILCERYVSSILSK